MVLAIASNTYHFGANIAPRWAASSFAHEPHAATRRPQLSLLAGWLLAREARRRGVLAAAQFLVYFVNMLYGYGSIDIRDVDEVL